MNKFYLTIGALALTCATFAQNGKLAAKSNVTAKPVANGVASKIIQHQNPAPQAAGDTVWVFDGLYSYDWNATLPASYSVALEDVDGLTIAPSYTPYFGTTGSFKIFVDTNAAATNLHYGHPDSVFFLAATSWFNPAGTANNWVEFGPIHVPAAGGTLKWMHNLPDPGYLDGYRVLVNTTGLSHTNFTGTPIFSVADNDPSLAGDTAVTPHYVWYSRSASVSAYAGQDIYIAFNHNAHDQDVLQLTNVMLVEAASTGIDNNLANGFYVGNNMPNPANGSTAIAYSLEKNSTVAFSVTDITGKVIYNENLGNVGAGDHKIRLNTASYTAGMYFYNFVINGNKVTRKFVVAD